jgi:hypothetical protein
MSNIGQPERETQKRVVALFRDELGYKYLGDWSDQHTNSNIEENLLGEYLTRAGYTKDQISRAKTHALKQGMMQELLTGRIRLVGTQQITA